MKKVIVVPIKLNNERFPGKNVKCFSDGTPLVSVALNALSALAGIDGHYVFCSHEAICRYISPPFQFLKRPDYLDLPEATPQDIIRELMDRVDAEIYMFSHVTSPFVSREHLEECISAVSCEGYDSAFTAHRIQKLLWQEDCTPLNFNAEKVPRTQDLHPLFEEVSAAYVFRKSTFQRLNRRIGVNPKIVEVSDLEAIDIDTRDDFVLAQAVYEKWLKLKKSGIGMQ